MQSIGSSLSRMATQTRSIVPAFNSLNNRCISASAVGSPRVLSAAVNKLRNKEELVNRLLTAKDETGKTFTQLSKETGLTNAYLAQLLYNQAQLKPGTVDKFSKAVPGISQEDLKTMQKVPFRSYSSEILKEPLVYRLQEAVHHYAEAIHAIVAEECGDGIMSAIDMFGNVDIIKGKGGEARVSIQLNGKFLPHIEQLEENNTAPRPSQH